MTLAARQRLNARPTRGRLFRPRVRGATVGFVSAQAPMMPTAPGLLHFATLRHAHASSCVRGTPSSGTHRCSCHTARRLERLARRGRHGSPGRCVRNPRTRTHPASGLPDATGGAPCRNIHAVPHWAVRSRHALRRYADAAACGLGSAAASALEHHHTRGASAVRRGTHDLQELGAEHFIRQGVGPAIRARGRQGQVTDAAVRLE